jgi:hypothetical protein
MRPPDAAAWQLGATVAMHADTLAVGPSHDWDLGQDHGGVRVFHMSGTRCEDAGEIRHPAADTQAFFGAAIALDAHCLAVGAPHDGTGGFQAGAVFVHERATSGWSLPQQLQRPHPMSGDLAGSAVALDANTLVIGVPKADVEGLDTGAAEVFERVDGAWAHAATLTAPQPRVGALFGLSVAVDTNVILVGAPGDDAAGPVAGRVHVFERAASGWRWTCDVECPAGPRGWFGASVAAARGLMVIGAPRALRSASGMAQARGAAWLLERSGDSWTCGARLVPSSSAEGDSLGCSAATDGGTIVLGATADGAQGRLAGCAFAFTRRANGSWSCQRLDPSSAQPASLIGHGVAVHGRRIAVGRLGDPEADPAPGEVTVFERIDAAPGSFAASPRGMPDA